MKNNNLRRQALFGLLGILILFTSNVYSCGYNSCPTAKEGYLNVHLVPHSHDDMGWLKTVDQYYYGANDSIQLAAVQFTLDSTIEELSKSSDRRFIYAETGYFWRWWTVQDETTQNLVKKLVESGQLEFINGGWCMNDEATTHYNEIIDQMSLGLRFLNDTFGPCGLPKVAWQIDPFGHSREQASLFAQMGFDGLFFGRLDYQDKSKRRAEKNMETIWTGSPNNLGKTSWLFTGALRNGYNPPDGFCFDILCSDEPIMDDPKLLGYNLDRKIDEFIQVSKEWAQPYRTNNILMTMGSDFHYLAARTWYKNLDKLIKHVNARQENGSLVNLFYSTPSCYLQETHKANLSWSVKSDDFFPYASDPHAFWTGYFTSRPTLKYFIHKTNNFLQICKHFAAFSSDEAMTEAVMKLAEPMAVAQHHDAIAGTAKQHVTFDYDLRLSIGIRSCEQVISAGYKELYNQKTKITRSPGNKITSNKIPSLDSAEAREIERSFQEPNFCHELNISSCAASETMTDFYVNIYSPMSRQVREKYIRVPVPTPNWKAYGPQGDIPIQVVNIPKPLFHIPGRNSSAQYELIIPVSVLPPLTVNTIGVTKVTTRDSENEVVKQPSSTYTRFHGRNSRNLNEDIRIENSKGLGFVLDGITGLIKSVSRFNKALDKEVEIDLLQNFYYYEGMAGNNSKFENRASGAYIFRPNGSQPTPIAAKVLSYTILRGKHVAEVHQTFNNWISQVIRLYENSESIEFEWLVGPIPIEDDTGKEIVTKYTSNLHTKGVFYTDANGRELLKRQRNYRPTWPYKVYEPIAGNYYPVNSRIILTESEGLTGSSIGKTLIILNDRAQGGSSNKDGEAELMIHRRLLYDDAFGVGEPLNETAYGEGLVVRGKHWLIFAGADTGVPVSIHRPLAQEIYQSPLLTFHNAAPTFHKDEKEVEETDVDDFDDNSSTSSSGSNEKDSIINMSFTRLFLPNTPTRILSSSSASVLPRNINLLTFEKIRRAEFLLRLEHFYEVGEDNEFSREVLVSVEDLQSMFWHFKSIRETTLGGNQWKNESVRLNWIPNPKSNERETEREHSSSSSNRIKIYNEGDKSIVWQPMEIKTFLLFY